MFPNLLKFSFLAMDSISSSERAPRINLLRPTEICNLQVKKEKLKKRFHLPFLSNGVNYCELLTSVFRHYERNKIYCIQPEMLI